MNEKSFIPSSALALRCLCSAFFVIALLANSYARPVPQNLGNGLDKIVENSLLQQNLISPPDQAQPSAGLKSVAGSRTAASRKTAVARNAAYVASYKAAVAREATQYASLALTDSVSGKYLVDIMPDGRLPLAQLQTALQAAFPAIDIRNIDRKYANHGVLEGYITLTDAPNIAKFNGVGSVILQLKPIHSVGAVTSQGVNQHRVNRINTFYNPSSTANWDGTGMSIGVMSDSYNSAPSAEGGFTYAPADVATGDLPGTGNLNNSQPVVVLQDYNPTPGATNEGRGMCQIVADIAPKARIGFATADVGEVGFANNIRALGGLAGFTYADPIQQGFKADVVCDDVSYLDEPMFQDGIVAQGAIDVVNAGITYCSSAANNWGTDGYDSVFRPVPNGTGLTAATNSALVGTNLNLAGVDPTLYAGGFHNFNPSGLDVAQTFNSSSDPQAAVFQWDDAYDTSVPTLGSLIFSGSGDSEAGQAVTFGPFAWTAGQEVVITEMATGTLPTQNLDAIVAIIDSNGNTIVDQDTGVDETVYFFPPTTGNYTIKVHPFSTNNVPTQGPFNLTINNASGVARITQDFNFLFFDTSGNFISAVASNNIANNRPYEVWVPTLSSTASQVQLVICRSNTTAPANPASHLKYVFFGNGAGGMGPAEYNNHLTPVTFGHSAAAGANSVAAYSMFRPNLPEDFTSPGPVVAYFDLNNNRLATPQLRLKPDIAAADGANNTFFPLGPGNDYPYDTDNFANFYGTSAASPHSAAIAALVLQAHKPTILTPQQVKTIMQLNTFPHDLDPYFSSGTATTTNGDTVTIGITSDNDSNTSTGSNDVNAWNVSYTGPGYLKTLRFNPEGTAITGGNPTGGNYSGLSDADFLDSTKYKFTPGMVFNVNQFKNGISTGLLATDATHSLTNAAPTPSTSAFYWTLNFAFPNNNLTTGKTYRFNIGRNQQQDATVPQGLTIANPLFGQTDTYSADILGNGVLIPEYADNPTILPGMTFSGTVSDGTTDYPFNGRIVNKIGHGYSRLDGYGFVNAEAATAATLPVAGVVSRKSHGAAGTFDIPLPLTGTPGVECRSVGGNNAYTLVFTFDRPVASAGNASVTQGTANIATGSDTTTASFGTNANEVRGELTGVTNAQHLTVTLSGVQDTSGDTFAPAPARMDVLLGDVNATGLVDGNDVSGVQGQTRIPVDGTNFKFDVNLSALIDGNDVSVTQSQTRTSLP